MTKNNKLKRWSLFNLIAGYISMSMFVLLVILNKSTAEDIETVDIDISDPEELFIPVPEEELVIETTPTGDRFVGHPIVIDRGVNYVDHLDGVVIDDTGRRHTVVVGDGDIIHDRINTINGNRVHDRVISGGNYHSDTVVGHDRVRGEATHVDRDIVGHRDRHHRVDVDGHDTVRFEDAVRSDNIDRGLLDRRLADLEQRELFSDEIGIDTKPDIDFSGLTLVRDNDDVLLGGADDLDIEFGDDAKGSYSIGKGGQLYAYNYPSRGVGAGIGNSAIGAGSGAGAGLGAGIGQGVLNGETVPTLGGVGTYSSVPVVTPGSGDDTDGDGLTSAVESALGTDPTNPDSDGDGYVDGAEITAGYSPRDSRSNPGKPGTESSPAMGGTGGLVGGAGAGGAAGLVTGMVTEKMGIGVGPGAGYGGGNGSGGRGNYNYDHLPKDGALHIMIHVDGSGSLLSTRVKLDEMKETLLKDALLPYYNNDESLYNKRVTIIDSSGERSLQFFAQAAKKDNVLALAFQDEAAPDYHLPNFNKKPQQAYSSDLGKLKSNLNGYNGVYRGVMFQVDRGRTFSKSFKELIECAWNGEGYLATDNLKKFHRDNNIHHIRNKNGIVFSDEYHAKSEADPQYYLDLIFKASKRIGLDLDIYGAGLTDGRYNKID